jgi:hypothetical protein
MNKWLNELKYNPILSFTECGDKAVLLFAQRDLFEKTVSVEDLWLLPESKRILRMQNTDGSWLYPGGKENIRTQRNYNQLETYRNLGILVEEYGFNKQHPSIQKAAKYLFTFQTQEGDFRGIYGNQYSPNYSAGITELLIKAGYEKDARIKKVFEWILSIQQKDGGWALPFRTQNYKIDVISTHLKTVKPDKFKPFSHMITGVILRAFAVHPVYRRSKEAQRAGELLLSNLFKKDHYPDRAASDYWLKFSFPFWYTDLISAIDSLSLLGFSRTEPQIDKALKWFIKSQQKNGLWNLKILKGQNKDVLQLWLALIICRIFKRFYN